MGLMYTFGSEKFDISSEPENNCNPVRGFSFLAWLRPMLEDLGCEVDGPHAEDWGWSLTVRAHGKRYMVGSYAILDPDGLINWIIQLIRRRSLLDRMQRKGLLHRGDEFAQMLERLIQNDADAVELDVSEVA